MGGGASGGAEDAGGEAEAGGVVSADAGGDERGRETTGSGAHASGSGGMEPAPQPGAGTGEDAGVLSGLGICDGGERVRHAAAEPVAVFSAPGTFLPAICGG